MSVKSTYAVNGMTCGNCVTAVTAELSRLHGVHEVTVELPTGAVIVESDGPLPIDEVRVAVDEAGYELAGVTG
jgi:copper chaperone CopZ